jgi:hypothetical protein
MIDLQSWIDRFNSMGSEIHLLGDDPCYLGGVDRWFLFPDNWVVWRSIGWVDNAHYTHAMQIVEAVEDGEDLILTDERGRRFIVGEFAPGWADAQKFNTPEREQGYYELISRLVEHIRAV